MEPHGYGERPASSADCRYVAFESHISLLSADTNRTWVSYVRDRQSGITELVSEFSAPS
jgi:hypothetical protein